jgi:hypothetical protein
MICERMKKKDKKSILFTFALVIIADLYTSAILCCWDTVLSWMAATLACISSCLVARSLRRAFKPDPTPASEL